MMSHYMQMVVDEGEGVTDVAIIREGPTVMDVSGIVIHFTVAQAVPCGVAAEK